MSKELAIRMEEAAKEFFRINGLDVSRPTVWCDHEVSMVLCRECWQSQLTVPLCQVARELLMFGGDVWPPSAFDNVLTYPTAHKPAASGSPLLAAGVKS